MNHGPNPISSTSSMCCPQWFPSSEGTEERPSWTSTEVVPTVKFGHLGRTCTKSYVRRGPVDPPGSRRQVTLLCPVGPASLTTYCGTPTRHQTLVSQVTFVKRFLLNLLVDLPITFNFFLLYGEKRLIKNYDPNTDPCTLSVMSNKLRL